MALAILCSGGDAPGMNAAIKKFVDIVYEKGETPYFIYDGLEGMIDDRIVRAEYTDVAGILHRGGTIIRSSRSKRFYDYAYRKRAYENLKRHGIDGLVVLGGDGSFRALEILCKEFDLRFVGIPVTIDNDIYGTEYCIGVDTAQNVIRDALDKIRDTASAFKRAFVVETMGRECGYLAAVSALTSGAEICVIPEVAFNQKVAEERLKEEVARGRNYILAIVAEGTGQTDAIAEWLEKTIGMETRKTILGHIQRGGNPTVMDRFMAFEFVIQSVEYLLTHQKANVAIGYREDAFHFMSIDEVTSRTYRIRQEILDGLHYLD